MKGLRIINGVLQARITCGGYTYSKCFGADTPTSRQIAEIWLAEKQKERLLGKIGIQPELPSKKFAEVAKIWFNLWKEETNPDGTPAHTTRSIQETERVIERVFIRYFRNRSFESIRSVDIERWRTELLQSGISGTGVNRYQATLSALFNGLERYIKTERIEAFKLPVDQQTGIIFNPCKFVKKAPNVKRKRVLSVNELKNLKTSCLEANDHDLWEICEMALKSLLRKKDLFALEQGIEIDSVQAKTNRPIHLPVSVLRPLNYKNFRKRWEAVRKAARLADIQFRDLRKTGATLLKMKKHSNKLISEYLGHSNTRTTEIYMVEDVEHLKPLAKDLEDVLKGL